VRVSRSSFEAGEEGGSSLYSFRKIRSYRKEGIEGLDEFEGLRVKNFLGFGIVFV
jgi:hypothetical protein